MKITPTKCPLCSSWAENDAKVLYPANFVVDDFNSQTFSARRLPDKVHYRLVRCVQDGMVRSSPVVDQKTLKQLYQRSEFTYQDEVENLTTTYLEALQPILHHLKKNGAILEIGCGNGFLLQKIKAPGYKNVWGVEPSQIMVKQAPPSLQKRIAVDFFRKQTFPEKKFSCIFFCQTLDHVADPNAFLKACYSHLLPGGYVMSFHHNVESASARLVGERHPIFDIEHTHLYDLKTTQLIFEKNRFLVRRVWSPQNTLSTAHLLHLLPLPRSVKIGILELPVATRLRHMPLRVSLGNICIIAQKASKK